MRGWPGCWGILSIVAREAIVPPAMSVGEGIDANCDRRRRSTSSEARLNGPAACRSNPARTGFVQVRRPSCLLGEVATEATSSLASAVDGVPGRSGCHEFQTGSARRPVPPGCSDRLLGFPLCCNGRPLNRFAGSAQFWASPVSAPVNSGSSGTAPPRSGPRACAGSGSPAPAASGADGAPHAP